MKRIAGIFACMILLGCGWQGGNTKPIDVLAPPRITVTTHIARTEDGISLALHRHIDGKSPQGAAVLLCHSMGFNSGVWQPGPKSGLATFLALEGYDVWRLDFRGCGMSGPAPPETTLDDYALKDIPAAIAHIAKATKRRKIFVIGHGTGGSAAMIYLLSAQESMMEGLVLIGSPLTIQLPRDAILRDLSAARRHLADPLLRYPSIVPDMSPPAPKGWESLFVKPNNIDPDVRGALFRQCSEPIPEGVLQQVVSMLQSGRLKSSDGKRTYLDECGAVRLPLLTVCGKGDNFAPPAALRAIYHKVSSVDKKFRLVCRASGDGEDFGNLDLICGKNVDAVVYHEIEQWLRERTGGRAK
ncbi:MAG: alpha/beta fold hydrolase [Planctomycetes bacterium]|nr:alpha/beta fold hydrolase [Planctomycetota bacterium]